MPNVTSSNIIPYTYTDQNGQVRQGQYDPANVTTETLKKMFQELSQDGKTTQQEINDFSAALARRVSDGSEGGNAMGMAFRMMGPGLASGQLNSQNFAASMTDMLGAASAQTLQGILFGGANVLGNAAVQGFEKMLTGKNSGLYGSYYSGAVNLSPGSNVAGDIEVGGSWGVGDVIGSTLSAEEYQLYQQLEPKERARFLLQKKIQEHAELVQLLANLLKIKHDTSMGVISKIG